MESLDTETLLARLVAFDTTSRNSNRALIDFVEEFLKGHGVRFETVPNEDGSKASLYATIGPDMPGGVILSGHTDVVPVDGQNWTNDPFVLTERDGKLYGRGTADMKGFVATVLGRVPALMERRLTRPVHIALSYDEEIGCLGVRPLLDHVMATQPRPSVCIVGEPSSMAVVGAHKGIRQLETTVTGMDGHSSAPDKGANAIAAAARLLGFLDTLAQDLIAAGDPTGRFEPPHTTLSVGTISGGTAVNIVPSMCCFGWEYRALPGTDPEAILERFETFAREQVLPDLQARTPHARIETSEIAHAPALAADPGSSAESLVLKLARQNTVETVAYATEGGLFQRAGVPSVICGPGDIAQAHRPDEFIARSELRSCEGFLDRLIDHLAEA